MSSMVGIWPSSFKVVLTTWTQEATACAEGGSPHSPLFRSLGPSPLACMLLLRRSWSALLRCRPCAVVSGVRPLVGSWGSSPCFRPRCVRYGTHEAPGEAKTPFLGLRREDTRRLAAVVCRSSVANKVEHVGHSGRIASPCHGRFCRIACPLRARAIVRLFLAPSCLLPELWLSKVLAGLLRRTCGNMPFRQFAVASGSLGPPSGDSRRACATVGAGCDASGAEEQGSGSSAHRIIFAVARSCSACTLVKLRYCHPEGVVLQVGVVVCVDHST